MEVGEEGEGDDCSDDEQHFNASTTPGRANPQPLERKSQRGSCLHQEFANDRLWGENDVSI
jgi:hypothetical protein